MKKVYGIDLGTTYSCISVVDEYNKPIVLNNADGQKITPSVVFFEDAGQDEPNIVVGNSAKSFAQMYPENVVTFIKRQMGTDFTFELKGETYRPEMISSLILRKLVNDAEMVVGEKIEDVVITVPAYFGINEREATKNAGEIAGLNVIGLINEPTAAAIAYGITKESNKRILVYDLGGGTFDVTLIDVKPEAIEVIVTGGDHNLGGKNWDDAIIDFLVDEYENQTGVVEDILENPETAQTLQLKAEEVKMMLTNRLGLPVTYTHDVDRIRVDFTREQFEKLTEPLVERTIDLTNLMLADARLKGAGLDQFDEIILVGGSTRMPQIKERLMREYNVEPIMFDPDEAVAKGAALYGQQKSIQDWVKKEIQQLTNAEIVVTEAASTKVILEKLSPTQKETIIGNAATHFKIAPSSIEKMATQAIKNVTSKSFGIVVVDESTMKEYVVNIIKKNDSLPCEITKEFGTLYDNQADVSLVVMENEMLDETLDVFDATKIGETILQLPSNLKANSAIEVTFKLQDDGRLVVTGLDRASNNNIDVTIQTNSVISEQEKEQTKVIVKDFIIS